MSGFSGLDRTQRTASQAGRKKKFYLKKKKKKKKKKKAGKRNQCEVGESSEYLQQTRPFSRKHNNNAPQRGERYFSIMLIQVNAL